MTTIEALRDSLPAADLFELPGHTRIDLDKRHVALRAGQQWWIYRRRPDGWLEKLDSWTGGRRTIFARLEQHGIEPTLAAEQLLDGLTEGATFREDEPEKQDTPIDDPSSPVDKSVPQGETTA